MGEDARAVILPERYRDPTVVGAGGMGTVYAAYDTNLGRQVAIKVLHPKHATKASGRALSQRLQREARVMAQLSHPNVLPVFDFGESDGRVFIAMELVDGWTLRQWLHESRPTPSWRQVVEVYLAAGEGLSAAHHAGLVHRDFKPENILVGRDARVRVSDFGLAQIRLTPDADAPGPLTPELPESLGQTWGQLTESGVLVGTPRYMAPEQLRGEPLDARADVFSFCLSLFESVTGALPFEADTPAQRLERITRGDLPATRGERAPPAWLLRLAARGMRLRPDERFGSMDELLVGLRRGLGARARLIRGTAGVGALAVAAALALVGWTGRHASDLRRGDPGAVANPARPSFAVLELSNRTGDAALDWLSQGLAELVGSELSTGGHLRMVEPARVAAVTSSAAGSSRARSSPGELETLGRLRAALDVDLAVLGAFRREGEVLSLELTLADLRTGHPRRASAHAQGRADEPWAVAAAATHELRRALSLPPPATEELAHSRSALPATLEASRAYTTALGFLRAHEPGRALAPLERVLQLEPEYAPAHSALALAHRELGHIAKARASSARALELSASLPRAQRLRVEGRYLRDVSRFREAADIYRALLTFFPDEVDDGLALATTQTAGGEPREALATLQRLRQLPAPLGLDPRIDLWESTAHARLHDSRKALESAERAAQKARARGALHLEAAAHELAAEALHNLGAVDEALARYQRASGLYAQVGHRASAASIEKARADVLADSGRDAEAADLYGRLTPIFGSLGDDYRLAGVHNRLGQLHGARGRFDRAHRAYEASLALYRALDDLEGVANVTYNRADLALANGDTSTAAEDLAQALALYERLGIAPYAAISRSRLAVVAWRRGAMSDALRQSDAAVSALRGASDPYSLAFALVDRGMILRDRADPRARATYEEARELLEKLGAVDDAAVVRVRLAELAWDDQTLEAQWEMRLREDLERLRGAGRGEASLAARLLALKAAAEQRRSDAQDILQRTPALFRPDIIAHRLTGSLDPDELEPLCAELATQSLYPLPLDCRVALAARLVDAGSRGAALAVLRSVERDATRASFLRPSRAAKRLRAILGTARAR